MKTFDFLLFLEPLLPVDVDVLSVSVVNPGSHPPHTLLRMTDFSASLLFFLFFLPFIPPLPPTSPRAMRAEMEGEMDDVVLNCDMSPRNSFHYFS